MKIRSAGAEWSHVDGGTDRKNMTNLIAAFRNFTNATKNGHTHTKSDIM